MSNAYFSWLANQLLADTVGASNMRWFTPLEQHQMAYCFLLSSKYGSCGGPLGTCDKLAQGVAMQRQPIPKAECPSRARAEWPRTVPPGGQQFQNNPPIGPPIRGSRKWCIPNKKTWRRLRHEFASAMDHLIWDPRFPRRP